MIIIIVTRTPASYTLAMGSGEIFENMLQLKCFGSYFEIILNSKWLLSYRNNDISYRDARGFRGMLPEKILKRLV